MIPVTVALKSRSNWLTAKELEPTFRPRGGSRDVSVGLHFNFTHWVPVTHQTKGAVMAAISPADLKAVGCKNPDVWVVSKNDDRIVITPSKTALKNGAYNNSKHVTEVSAASVLGDDWQKKLNPLKFHDRYDVLRRAVGDDDEAWEGVNESLRRNELLGAIFNETLGTMTLLLRAY